MKRRLNGRLVLPLVAGLLGGPVAGRALAQDQGNQQQGQKDDKASADVDALVKQLGADDFQKREEAQKKLVAIGAPALPALQKAEKESTDAEVRARAHDAIAAIQNGGGSPDTPKQDQDRPQQGPDTGPQIQPIQPFNDPNMKDLEKELQKQFGQDFGKDFELPDEMKQILKQLQGQLHFKFDPSQGGNGFHFEFGNGFGNEDQNGRGGPRFYRQFQTERSRTPAEDALGLTMNPPQPALRSQLDLSDTDAALVIDEITPGSLAEKAGLQRYDVVTAVNGKPVRTVDDLLAVTAQDSTIDVVRKAKKQTLEVKALGAPKQDQPPSDDGKDKQQIRKF